MSEYKYPKDLTKALEMYSSECNETITTYNEDSVVFIIIPKDLEKWVIIIEWYLDEEFSFINVNRSAFDRLHKVIHEIEDKLHSDVKCER